MAKAAVARRRDPGQIHLAWLRGLLIVASAGFLACTGQVPQGSQSGEGAQQPGDALPADSTTSPGLSLPPSVGMRRLTRTEFKNSLRDLLGVAPTLDVEPDTRIDGFEKVGAARVAVSPVGTELYERAIYQTLASAWSDPTKRSLVMDCDLGLDMACSTNVVTRFGRRAWRRSLNAAEVKRYVDLAASTGGLLGDQELGLRHAVAGLLQSPNFLYRIELGEPDPPSPGRLRYNDHEVATRLSFFLTNSLPDDELSAAADRGELTTTEGILTQTQRILGSTRGRESIRGFARELFNLPAVDSVPKDAALYPEFTDSLRASLREELERLWETAAFAPGSQLLDVLTTRSTFADDEIAGLYGLAKTGTGTMLPVVLPESGLRSGLLGTGAFLAVRAKTNETTPTLRGRFVREVLMCQAVPSPPPEVNTTLPMPLAGVVISRRQQLEQHRSSPSCAGCHALMDPIGLALENFDAVGRYRDMDRGLPIDASGNLDGALFSDPRELNQRLRESPSVRACLMRNLYRYALGQSETSGGEAWIDELSRSFDQSGQRFVDFTLSFVTSDLFRFASSQSNAKESP